MENTIHIHDNSKRSLRLTYGQMQMLSDAAKVTLNVQADDDPGRPPWVDIEAIDSTDLHLISVRFPGRCRLPQAKIEDMREEGETGEGFDGHAIGIFVVVLDHSGNVVFVRHTAAGALKLDRAGQAVQD